jgi:hypothetical protein
MKIASLEHTVSQQAGSRKSHGRCFLVRPDREFATPRPTPTTAKFARSLAKDEKSEEPLNLYNNQLREIFQTSPETSLTHRKR